MSEQQSTTSRRRLAWVVGIVAALSVAAGLLIATGAWETIDAQRRAASWDEEKPTGRDRVTARMRAVRAAVAKEFDLPAGSGCYREDGGIAGGGEHPLGRACDFMLGPAGERAKGDRHRLGEDIVAWVRENAEEYGIWYVIYEQHIWSSRWPNQGYEKMEDRGSITQNHFDHVHISVY